MRAPSSTKTERALASVLLIAGEIILSTLFIVGAAVALTSICVVGAVIIEVLR